MATLDVDTQPPMRPDSHGEPDGARNRERHVIGRSKVACTRGRISEMARVVVSSGGTVEWASGGEGSRVGEWEREKWGATARSSDVNYFQYGDCPLLLDPVNKRHPCPSQVFTSSLSLPLFFFFFFILSIPTTTTTTPAPIIIHCNISLLTCPFINPFLLPTTRIPLESKWIKLRLPSVTSCKYTLPAHFYPVRRAARAR